jgi:hypothetical protein
LILGCLLSFFHEARSPTPRKKGKVFWRQSTKLLGTFADF